MEGLRVATRLHLRTGWRSALIWVLALGATMLATTLSISGLYDTQAKIDGYAAATSAGDALQAINGRVFGLDTLGGVIQDEFGFVASCALPLMGILLVARATRGEEESGRVELVLAGRLSRHAPLVASLLVTLVALLLTVLIFALSLVVVGIGSDRAWLYALSLGCLALIFASVAALSAQLVAHARDVTAIGLGLLVISYLLRGIGDVQWHPLTWCSPLGWAEETRAFGDDPRWWPLALPVFVSVALITVAVRVRARRDVDAAALQRDLAAGGASRWLRTPLGTATALHRGPIITWTAIGLVVGGAFGALAEQAVDAMGDNSDLATAMGGSAGGRVDGFVGMVVLLIALCAAACGVQAVRALATEEGAGRVESILGGGSGRMPWLGAHTAVAVTGVLAVSVAGGVAAALGTAWSTGDSGRVRDVLLAQTAYLPPVLLVVAVTLALHGVRPRPAVLGWALVAFCALVALLGDALQLPGPVTYLSPMTHVGHPPLDQPGPLALTLLSVTVLVVACGGFTAFRRRDIPG